MGSFRISGLRSRPDLNGREVVVVGTQGARKKVRVVDTGVVVALKAENLCHQKDGYHATCDGCGKSFDREEVKFCARCKAPKYCSKVCQKRHWPAHKLMCGQLARARDNARRAGVGAGCAGFNASRAQERVFEGKTESAKKYIAKALAADPENSFARLQQAMMLCVDGDYDGAIPVMEATLRQGYQSHLGALEYNIGKAYHLRGRPGDQQRAIKHLRDGWAKNSQDSSTALLIAGCYKSMHTQSRAAAYLDEAERWGKRAYALDENEPRASTISAFDLAAIYLLKSDFAAAIPLLEAVLRKNPRDLEAKGALDKARSMM